MKYIRVNTIGEACALLSLYKKGTHVVAGGTDLLVQMKSEKVLPEYVIDIGEIAGNDYITYDDNSGLRIGAQTKIRDIAVSPVVRSKFDFLAEAAANLGSPQVRNMATMVGNLCNASPSAETVPPLTALEAIIRVVGSTGERDVPIEKFATSPGNTVLETGEIVKEVAVPPLPPHTAGVYLAHTMRKVNDLAAVNIAAVVTINDDIIENIKIALGAVAPTVIRARKAEEVLVNNVLDDGLLDRAVAAALQEISPIDDVRCSAQYRCEITGVLVARAVRLAVDRAKKS